MNRLHVFDLFTWLVPFLTLGVVGDGAGGGTGASVDAGGGSGGVGAGGGQGGEGSGGTTTPTLDFRTFINPDGSLAKPKEFWEAMGTPHLATRFTDLKALPKSYVSAERMLSNSKKVAVPNENSTPEEWDAFFAAAGRPGKPEEYGLAKPEGVPEEIWSEDEAKEFATLAHKLGLSKKAANALVQWQAERLGKSFSAQSEQAEQAKAQAIEGLKKEWGTGYDANLKLAKQAAVTFGGEELLNHPLANDPAFIKAMAKAGAAISEGKLAGGRQGGPGVETPETIKAEIGSIMADKNHPYWLPKHPNHEAAVEQVKRLYGKLHPEPKG